MHTAATDGIEASAGSGRTAFAHIATILPGVSAPSRVVRSTHRMARSRAHSLASRLIDRLASAAARSSSPTASTGTAPATSAAAPAAPETARSMRRSRWAMSEGAFAMRSLAVEGDRWYPIELQAQPVQRSRVPLPVLDDPDPQVEKHPSPQDGLDLLTGLRPDPLQHLPAPADHDPLLRIALHHEAT